MQHEVGSESNTLLSAAWHAGRGFSETKSVWLFSNKEFKCRQTASGGWTYRYIDVFIDKNWHERAEF